jgi:uncharacterized protein YebE (UPF0316 family)
MEAIFLSPWGPVCLFLLRICDVSMSTMRTVLSVRGQKRIVPFIGFVEILMWLQAAGAAMKFMSNPLIALGYAAGFAAGTFVGISIEEKLAFGLSTVRVISSRAGAEIAEALRSHGYGVTQFGALGRHGRVAVLLVVCKRKQLRQVLAEIRACDPSAFITVEEPKAMHAGILSDPRNPYVAAEAEATAAAAVIATDGITALLPPERSWEGGTATDGARPRALGAVRSKPRPRPMPRAS